MLEVPHIYIYMNINIQKEKSFTVQEGYTESERRKEKARNTKTEHTSPKQKH